MNENFLLGCNYWASHAGAFMWSRWDAEVVARDFDALAECGQRVLRVFPLWPDFQPLDPVYGFAGRLIEMRLAGQPRPDTPAGRAGLDETMLERFAHLVDLAEERRLQLIVPLLTGWMSGRLFVPAALANRNLLTDPLCVQWEVRLVKGLVERFRDRSGILAWELGNECNCLGSVTGREEAWRWMQALGDAIRATDPTRPVLSGLWGELDGGSSWAPPDLGELFDLVTAHSYPHWMPHVMGWPLGEERTLLHATVAARLQSDLGRRPCLAEEIGCLGPMYAGRQTAAEHLRGNLWNLWAEGIRGCLWWCSFDFDRVADYPYDSIAMEAELGLLDAERRPRPTAEEYRNFAAMLDALPPELAALPAPRREAVCVLSPEQDQWAAALMSFCLARQAGFDVQFVPSDRSLPEAELYLVPALTGNQGLPAPRWAELRERMAAGATVYLSLADGAVAGFAALSGVEILRRGQRLTPVTLRAPELGTMTLPLAPTERAYDVQVHEAEVLAVDDTGEPLLTVCAHGAGRLYCLFAGLETGLALDRGVGGDELAPYLPLYRLVAAPVLTQRLLRKPDDTPRLYLSEHPLADGSVAAVAINNSPHLLTVDLIAAPQIASAEVLAGEGRFSPGVLHLVLPAYAGAVIHLRLS